jgi:peptidoglycan/xylan/chitin deacetylase (PgdA/CDA1 family)
MGLTPMAALRGLVKTVAAEAACRTGADRLLAAMAAPAGEPLVLGYHQVVEDGARAEGCIPAMLVRARTLERQLEAVGRRCRFVSLDELGERLESGAPPDRPLAAVTFDDGYRDVYEHAFPLLRRKGIPAAVFVVTDLVGTSRLQRHDRAYRVLSGVLAEPGGAGRVEACLAHLRLPVSALLPVVAGVTVFSVLRALLEGLTASELEAVLEALDREGAAEGEDVAELQPLTWEMVGEMHRAGITIGSHSRTHPLLTHECRDRVRDELRRSRQELEGRLRAPVRHFAYPDGAFDADVVDEVAAAGYPFAYTTCRHRDARHPLLTVPRRLLWENSARDGAGRFSPAIMRCQVHGVFDLVSRCRRDHRRPERGRAWARPA